ALPEADPGRASTRVRPAPTGPLPPIGGHRIPPHSPPIARQTSHRRCGTVISPPEKPAAEIESTVPQEVRMTNTITRNFTRWIALPAISAGLLGGAALGLAGMANAGTYPTHDPSPRPG